MDATQMPLSDTETVFIGVVVSVVVLASATWPLVQHFHVMAHEGMHAVVGSLAGHKVRGIVLKSSAEGETPCVPESGPGYYLAGFAGYLGSSAFGLGAARLIEFGHIIAVLWVSLLMLGLLLVALKPSFGYFTVPLAGFLIFLVLKHMSQTAEIRTAYVITWFLLLSGVRAVVEHHVNAGDARILARRTSIPRLVWFVLWLVGTVTAMAIGALWMLHPAVHPPTR